MKKWVTALEISESNQRVLLMKTCRPCSRYRDQIERALELLAALPPQPVATSEVDDIMAMLESAKG